MKHAVTIALILLSVPKSFADKLEKGFERLKAFDYFNAKMYFEKSLDDELSPAAYGLSSIYSSDKNPFYNPDSARRYILISDSTFKISKEKKKKYYAELGVTDSSIRKLSEYICNDAFQRAKKTDSVSTYNHYLQSFSTCAEYTNVTSLRNSAAFRDARNANTSVAFKNFMALYPQSEQFNDAMSMYDERIFSENTLDKTIESYAYFLQNYPESPYKIQAEKMIYSLSTPNKSLSQYVAFAREYKGTQYADSAWHEIYKLDMKDFTQASFDQFKKTYPDYPFPEELESDFMLQNFFFLPFQEEDSWGYINEFGEEMIKPLYDEASLFSEGLALVSEEEQFGYINKAGKKVIDFKFKDGESFHNGIAVVSADSLYGAINKSGEFVIAPQYEELSEIGDDVYMGVKNDLSGYLTKKGKPLTQFIFDVAGDFRNGYAVVSKDEKFGLINISGAYNIEPKYENLSFIGDGLLKAQNEDDAWGIVNVQGQIILPFLYDAIGDFSEHRALVVKGEKCGYINESGEIIIPVNFRYTSIMLTQAKFMDGYALMKQKLKSILIDTTGKPVTFPGVLDYGRPSSGLIPVKKNKRWGYADLSGKIVIQPLFESAEPFSHGYATIHMNKMAGLIDSTGTIFIQPLYEDVIAMDKVFLIKSNGKFGLLSLSGILLVPCQYEKIEFLSPSVAKPINSTGYCYVNLNTGKIIWTRI